MSSVHVSALLGTNTSVLQSPCRGIFRAARRAVCLPGRRLLCKAEENAAADPASSEPSVPNVSLDKEVTKFARNAATTFAPRASGATSNPAFKGKFFAGSLLYSIFEWQAWASLVVGGLLSFNIIFPSDQPDIARLLGMWSIWMFTVPSLRARECTAPEKDALNLLFLAIPLLNVALPFVYKNFGFIYSADVVMLAGVYAWKGLLPFSGESSEAKE